VKGERRKGPDENHNDSEYEKNEWKFGEFTIRFRIPEDYERKWCSLAMENGILIIKYKKDMDENESEELVTNNSTSNEGHF